MFWVSPSYYLVFSPGDKGDTKSHHYSEGGGQGKLEVDKVGQLRQCQHVCEDLGLVLLVVQDVLGLMLLHNSM